MSNNTQLPAEWVRSSDKLPLHKAFWNMPGQHNNNECYFPVRIDGFKYRVGEIFDNRHECAPDPIYYFVIDGKDYFEKDFDRIEWLNEAGATEYAIKRHEAQQEIRALKGSIETHKRSYDAKSKDYDELYERLETAEELLKDVISRHEAGLLPDRFIYNDIKSFLDGK